MTEWEIQTELSRYPVAKFELKMDGSWMEGRTDGCTLSFPDLEKMKPGHVVRPSVRPSGEYVTKSPEDGKPNRTQGDTRTHSGHGCWMTQSLCFNTCKMVFDQQFFFPLLSYNRNTYNGIQSVFDKIKRIMMDLSRFGVYSTSSQPGCPARYLLS